MLSIQKKNLHQQSPNFCREWTFGCETWNVLCAELNEEGKTGRVCNCFVQWTWWGVGVVIETQHVLLISLWLLRMFWVNCSSLLGFVIEERRFPLKLLYQTAGHTEDSWLWKSFLKVCRCSEHWLAVVSRQAQWWTTVLPFCSCWDQKVIGAVIYSLLLTETWCKLTYLFLSSVSIKLARSWALKP